MGDLMEGGNNQCKKDNNLERNRYNLEWLYASSVSLKGLPSEKMK